MTIKIFKISDDAVIKSIVGIGSTNYAYALKNLVPLIDSLAIQRNVQSRKFYEKLERDLLEGCIIPPITLAFINTEDIKIDFENIELYISSNIERGFILDGIQRLSAIKRVYDESSLLKNTLNLDKVLYINLIISNSQDTLLYRMITLNNGQKPMSPRHQIEALSEYVIKFNDQDYEVYTEKDGRRAKFGAFRKADIVKAYLAYMSKSYSIENKKIIEEKMDELLVERITDNRKQNNEKEFSDVLKLIQKLSLDSYLYEWFKNEYNIIGFCSAIRESYDEVNNVSIKHFRNSIEQFESFFASINVSTINVGKARRRLTNVFIFRFALYQNYDSNELLDELSEEI